MLVGMSIGLSRLGPIHDGLIFPASYLKSRFFLICLTFVAINTLVYLGLTLIKLLPRPKPQFLRTATKPEDETKKRKFF
jgi:hypothetical protein